MAVKEWLLHSRNLNREVQQLIEAKEKAFNSACEAGTEFGNERVQITRKNSSEEKFTTYSEYSLLLREKIEELERYQARVVNAISRIDDTTLRTLLTARYINCKTWEQIAEDMGYSDKWVKTGLHSKALMALKDIYDTAE